LSGVNGEFANFTTARQPLQAIGQRAVEMLSDLIDGVSTHDSRALFEATLLAGWTTIPGQTVARRLLAGA